MSVLFLSGLSLALATGSRLSLFCSLTSSGASFGCAPEGQGQGYDEVIDKGDKTAVVLSSITSNSSSGPVELSVQSATSSRLEEARKTGSLIEVVDAYGRVTFQNYAENKSAPPLPTKSNDVLVLGDAGASPVSIKTTPPSGEVASGSAAFIGEASDVTIDVRGADGPGGRNSEKAAAMAFLKGEFDLGDKKSSALDKMGLGSTLKSPAISADDLDLGASGCASLNDSGGSGFIAPTTNPDGSFTVTVKKAREQTVSRAICQRDTGPEISVKSVCVRPEEKKTSLRCNYDDIVRDSGIYKRPSETKIIGFSCADTVPFGHWVTQCASEKRQVLGSAFTVDALTLAPSKGIVAASTRTNGAQVPFYGTFGDPNCQQIGRHLSDPSFVSGAGDVKYASLFSNSQFSGKPLFDHFADASDCAGNGVSPADLVANAGGLVKKRASKEFPGTAEERLEDGSKKDIGRLSYWAATQKEINPATGANIYEGNSSSSQKAPTDVSAPAALKKVPANMSRLLKAKNSDGKQTYEPFLKALTDAGFAAGSEASVKNGLIAYDSLLGTRKRHNDGDEVYGKRAISAMCDASAFDSQKVQDVWQNIFDTYEISKNEDKCAVYLFAQGRAIAQTRIWVTDAQSEISFYEYPNGKSNILRRKLMNIPASTLLFDSEVEEIPGNNVYVFPSWHPYKHYQPNITFYKVRFMGRTGIVARPSNNRNRILTEFNFSALSEAVSSEQIVDAARMREVYDLRFSESIEYKFKNLRVGAAFESHNGASTVKAVKSVSDPIQFEPKVVYFPGTRAATQISKVRYCPKVILDDQVAGEPDPFTVLDVTSDFMFMMPDIYGGWRLTPHVTYFAAKSNESQSSRLHHSNSSEADISPISNSVMTMSKIAPRCEGAPTQVTHVVSEDVQKKYARFKNFTGFLVQYKGDAVHFYFSPTVLPNKQSREWAVLETMTPGLYVPEIAKGAAELEYGSRWNFTAASFWDGLGLNEASSEFGRAKIYNFFQPGGSSPYQRFQDDVGIEGDFYGWALKNLKPEDTQAKLVLKKDKAVTYYALPRTNKWGAEANFSMDAQRNKSYPFKNMRIENDATADYLGSLTGGNADSDKNVINTVYAGQNAPRFVKVLRNLTLLNEGDLLAKKTNAVDYNDRAVISDGLFNLDVAPWAAEGDCTALESSIRYPAKLISRQIAPWQPDAIQPLFLKESHPILAKDNDGDPNVVMDPEVSSSVAGDARAGAINHKSLEKNRFQGSPDLFFTRPFIPTTAARAGEARSENGYKEYEDRYYFFEEPINLGQTFNSYFAQVHSNVSLYYGEDGSVLTSTAYPSSNEYQDVRTDNSFDQEVENPQLCAGLKDNVKGARHYIFNSFYDVMVSAECMATAFHETGKRAPYMPSLQISGNYTTAGTSTAAETQCQVGDPGCVNGYVYNCDNGICLGRDLYKAFGWMRPQFSLYDVNFFHGFLNPRGGGVPSLQIGLSPSRFFATQYNVLTSDKPYYDAPNGITFCDDFDNRTSAYCYKNYGLYKGLFASLLRSKVEFFAPSRALLGKSVFPGSPDEISAYQDATKNYTAGKFSPKGSEASVETFLEQQGMGYENYIFGASAAPYSFNIPGITTTATMNFSRIRSNFNDISSENNDDGVLRTSSVYHLFVPRKIQTSAAQKTDFLISVQGERVGVANGHRGDPLIPNEAGSVVQKDPDAPSDEASVEILGKLTLGESTAPAPRLFRRCTVLSTQRGDAGQSNVNMMKLRMNGIYGAGAENVAGQAPFNRAMMSYGLREGTNGGLYSGPLFGKFLEPLRGEMNDCADCASERFNALRVPGFDLSTKQKNEALYAQNREGIAPVYSSVSSAVDSRTSKDWGRRVASAMTSSNAMKGGAEIIDPDVVPGGGIYRTVTLGRLLQEAEGVAEVAREAEYSYEPAEVFMPELFAAIYLHGGFGEVNGGGELVKGAGQLYPSDVQSVDQNSGLPADFVSIHDPHVADSSSTFAAVIGKFTVNKILADEGLKMVIQPFVFAPQGTKMAKAVPGNPPLTNATATLEFSWGLDENSVHARVVSLAIPEAGQSFADPDVTGGVSAGVVVKYAGSSSGDVDDTVRVKIGEMERDAKRGDGLADALLQRIKFYLKDSARGDDLLLTGSDDLGYAIYDAETGVDGGASAARKVYEVDPTKTYKGMNPWAFVDGFCSLSRRTASEGGSFPLGLLQDSGAGGGSAQNANFMIRSVNVFSSSSQAVVLNPFDGICRSAGLYGITAGSNQPTTVLPETDEEDACPSSSNVNEPCGAERNYYWTLAKIETVIEKDETGLTNPSVTPTSSCGPGETLKNAVWNAPSSGATINVDLSSGTPMDSSTQLPLELDKDGVSGNYLCPTVIRNGSPVQTTMIAMRSAKLFENPAKCYAIDGASMVDSRSPIEKRTKTTCDSSGKFTASVMISNPGSWRRSGASPGSGGAKAVVSGISAYSEFLRSEIVSIDDRKPFNDSNVVLSDNGLAAKTEFDSCVDGQCFWKRGDASAPTVPAVCPTYYVKDGGDIPSLSDDATNAFAMTPGDSERRSEIRYGAKDAFMVETDFMPSRVQGGGSVAIEAAAPACSFDPGAEIKTRPGFAASGDAPSDASLFTEAADFEANLGAVGAITLQPTPWSSEKTSGDTVTPPPCSIFDNDDLTSKSKSVRASDLDASGLLTLNEGSKAVKFKINPASVPDSSLAPKQGFDGSFSYGGRWTQIGVETTELKKANDFLPIQCTFSAEGISTSGGCGSGVTTTVESVDGFQAVLRAESGGRGGRGGRAVILTGGKPQNVSVLTGGGVGGTAGSTNFGAAGERSLMCYKTSPEADALTPWVRIVRFSRSSVSVAPGAPGSSGGSIEDPSFVGYGVMPEALDWLKGELSKKLKNDSGQ